MYKLKERKREREREGERKKPLDGVQLSSISCVCPLNPYAQAQMNPGNVTLSGMPLRYPQHRLIHTKTNRHTHTRTHTHHHTHTHTPRRQAVMSCKMAAPWKVHMLLHQHQNT